MKNNDDVKDKMFRIFIRFLKEEGTYGYTMNDTCENTSIASKYIKDLINTCYVRELSVMCLGNTATNKLRKHWETYLILKVTNKNAKEVFNIFLDKYKANEKFYLTLTKMRKHKTWLNNIRNISITGYINNAFCWSDTEDGHYYWQKLSKEWVNYLDKLLSVNNVVKSFYK